MNSRELHVHLPDRCSRTCKWIGALCSCLPPVCLCVLPSCLPAGPFPPPPPPASGSPYKQMNLRTHKEMKRMHDRKKKGKGRKKVNKQIIKQVSAFPFQYLIIPPAPPSSQFDAR
mmetsp:Transcript_2067/g.4352  ORF Transcript_2067/g.4352 Transcript_2067/m.4352 type:complete len:115 (-) Transcript_2067:379-723(-)